eukprot:UN02426
MEDGSQFNSAPSTVLHLSYSALIFHIDVCDTLLSPSSHVELQARQTSTMNKPALEKKEDCRAFLEWKLPKEKGAPFSALFLLLMNVNLID